MDYPAVDMSVGTRAMNVTRPTKEQANSSQMLYELLLDVPKIPLGLVASFMASKPGAKKGTPRTLKGAPSSSGDEYLNWVFGWQPLVADVLKICHAIVNADGILKQYARDSGRGVRRRYKEDQINGSTQSRDMLFDWGLLRANVPYQQALLSNVSAVSTRSTAMINTTQKSWFSGQWEYYLHEGSSFE